jgi:hypothetical protein
MEASRQEVDRYLTGKETEPWEIIYFKLYKTQLPVVEQALETAALMLGTDKSREYPTCPGCLLAATAAGATSTSRRLGLKSLTRQSEKLF